jgi:lysophospholipase
MRATTFLERAGEPKLRVATWQPESPKGSVLITTGYAESLERYEHVAARWHDAGFCVACYDLRGQGTSEGRRGHIDRFAQFTSDLFAVLAYVQQQPGWSVGGPPIAFGHSLGGLITTVAALERPRAFRGLGLGSPFWGLAIKPAAWKVFVGNKLTNIWPTYSDSSGVALDLLTHDKAKVAMFEADGLRIKRVTARWFTETQLAQQRVAREFGSLSVPVLCLASGEDHIADVATTRRVFSTPARPNHELRIKDGAYHELHQELARNEYLDEFASRFEQWCA